MSIRGLIAALLLVLVSTQALAKDCVILLHGLSRAESSFLLMEEALNVFDYKVVNSTYPSTEMPVPELLGHIDKAVAECGEAEQIHFVTHSMGAILLRAWLINDRPKNLGRTVMLGPPNHGSELVDRFGHLWLFEFLTGPAGLDLGRGAESLPNKLGPADFDVGIIAGNRSTTPLPGIFNGPNDGFVAVDSTLLEGVSDHLVLPVTHTFMMNNPIVIAQVLYFLAYGKFDRQLTLRSLLQSVIHR